MAPFVLQHGGEEIFGRAIGEARAEGQRVTQTLANAEVVFDPSLPSGSQVSLAPLGWSLGLASPPVAAPGGSSRYFETTGHSVDIDFQTAFDKMGGQPVVGAPISEAAQAGDIVYQYYENLGMYRTVGATPETFGLLAYGYASRPEVRPASGAVLPPDAHARPFALFLDQYGGEAVFGRPLTEAYAADDGGLEQVFENAVLYAPGNAPGTVRLRPLGSALGEAEPAVEGSSDTVGLYFPQTGHFVLWAFANFYRAHGGEQVIGLPLEEAKSVDGVLSQRFENARLEYHPELPPHLAVQLSPLGEAYAVGRGVTILGATSVGGLPTASPELCAGTAAVATAPEMAILPSGTVQRITIQVQRSNGQPWRGAVPIVVVHAPEGDLYPVVPPTDDEGETIASVTLQRLSPGEIVNYEVVVAGEQCTGYAIGQFAGGL